MVQQVICVEYSNANFLYSKRSGRSHTEDSKPSVFSWAVVLNEDFWVTRQQLTSFRIAHGETEACEESHPRPLAQERGISMYLYTTNWGSTSLGLEGSCCVHTWVGLEPCLPRRC